LPIRGRYRQIKKITFPHGLGQPATNGGGSPSVRSSFSRGPASPEQQFRFAPSPAALLHYYNSRRKKRFQPLLQLAYINLKLIGWAYV
jgi:hypothetical protein